MNNIGRKVIIFTREIGADHYWVSAEVRTGRKELAFQSMWKRQARREE